MMLADDSDLWSEEDELPLRRRYAPSWQRSGEWIMKVTSTRSIAENAGATVGLSRKIEKRRANGLDCDWQIFCGAVARAEYEN